MNLEDSCCVLAWGVPPFPYQRRGGAIPPLPDNDTNPVCPQLLPRAQQVQVVALMVLGETIKEDRRLLPLPLSSPKIVLCFVVVFCCTFFIHSSPLP